MKKIRLLVFFVFIFLLSVSKASAENVEVTTDFFDGVYSNRQFNGITYWGKFAYIKINGQIGYCLDPSNIIQTTNYYTSDNFSMVGLSDEDIRKIENYAYYGYGYEGHTSKEYYMATQQLIWEVFPDYVIYYTTEGNKQGNVIDISSYMQEIKDTIASNNKYPSLPGNISGKVGQSMMISDKNNILHEYELETNSPNVSIDGNQLIVNFNEPMFETIIIRRKPRNNIKSLLYLANNSQTVSLLGLNHQNKIRFTVETLPLKKAILRVNKKDELSDTNIKSKVKYKIKNRDTNEFFTYNGNMIFESTEEGLLELPFYLEEGNYSIIEVEAPYGYYKDENEFLFSITEDTELVDDKYLDIDFYNAPILSKLIIKKVDKDLNKVLSNAVFEIYNESNELIDTITTDENGIAVLEKLRYGKYFIKEIQAPDGYIVSKDIKEIEIDSDKVMVEMYNQKINAPDTNVSKNSFIGFIGILVITVGIIIIRKIKSFSN